MRVGKGRRERLERLLLYIARPPLAQERLSVTRRGDVIYRLCHPWKNGRTAVVLDPMTLLSWLAAQVPPPRRHGLTYQGVLAPAAARRDFNGRYVRSIDLRLQRWRRHPRRWPR